MNFLRLPHRVEYERYGPASGSPTLVLLHHGLGSVSAWREFPEKLATAAGLPVVAYSRRGHGGSDSLPPRARGADFMHREAREDLPALLRHLRIDRPLLIGHSDGASIALIYAAEGNGPAPEALVLVAPHVLVEECTLEGARAARRDYDAGSLRAALARHHADVESAFRSWNDTWLSREFRDWNIADLAPRVPCPVLLVQGLADQYGTTLHVDHIAAAAPGPARTLLLGGCGHRPERERPSLLIAAITDLLGHHDGDEIPATVFHLTTRSLLRAGMRDGAYRPESLRTAGFVHCAADLTVALAVAADLFTGGPEPLLLIEIDTARLDAPVRMEAAAPVAGMAATHRGLARRFPHVYGHIERAAMSRVHVLERHGHRFALPAATHSIDAILDCDTIDPPEEAATG